MSVNLSWIVTLMFWYIFLLHLTHSAPTWHLWKAVRFRLIMHWGTVRPTLFFFCSVLVVCVCVCMYVCVCMCVCVCMWVILQGNVDMLRRGKLLWSSRKRAGESPEMCFQLVGCTKQQTATFLHQRRPRSWIDWTSTPMIPLVKHRQETHRGASWTGELENVNI